MKHALATVLVTGILAGCATTSAPSGPPRVAYPMKQQTGYDPAMDTAKDAGIGGVLGALGGAACMAGRGHSVK
jgi:hypothetical protein